MVEFLRGKGCERKLRLFAVACCRRHWPLFREAAVRRAVEAAESYADGLIDRRERRLVIRQAYFAEPIPGLAAKVVDFQSAE